MRRLLTGASQIRPLSFPRKRESDPHFHEDDNQGDGQTWDAPLLTALFLFAVFCSLARADTIYFKAGGTLTGLVVEEHRDRLVVSTEEGEKTLLRQEVEDLFYSEPERNHLYLGRQALDDSDYALARGFFQKALQINPLFSEAEDALGQLEDLELKSAQGFRKADGALKELSRSWGMEVEQTEAGWVRIVTVREKSPAAAAGLRPGDGFIRCWGESLGFLSPAEAAEKLLGPAGTEVKLTIERAISLSASPKKWNWPGWKLVMERLGLTVRQLDSSGAARRAELLPGDRIMAIDGQPTRYLLLEEARRRFREGRKKGVQMVFHRDWMIRRP